VTAAYYLPGEDVSAWIAAMAGWNTPMGALRLYIVPKSSRDLSPAGALVIGRGLPPGAESPACLPYGCLAGKLYLPAQSEIQPAATDEEFRRLLPGHLYVLHPSTGLVGFEQADALGPHQLIAPPAPADEQWNRAVPGVGGAARLRSVTVPPVGSPGDLLEQGREDIANDSPDDIPELPNDPAGSMAGRAAGKALLGMFKFFGAIGNALGGKGGPPRADEAGAKGGSISPGDKRPGALGNWLNRKMTALSQRLLAARFKEIARLMQLMETDPDQGLRYALPLAGLGHRGLAAPGARLAPRSTRFELGMLSGGRAADLWDMPYEYQARLTQQYRQTANREMELGRFRRAAYVYAVLLGDYHSAANALRQGRHFREAAALYKDHLKNPTEAARCLEQGGLLPEAIALYEEQERFEKAGDLYTVLHQGAEAEAAYRRAVAQACQAGRRIDAAGILERKIRAIDEAVEVLAAGWPLGPQAAQCLQARLELLGRAGRHGDSRRLLGSLPGQTPPRHRLDAIAALTDSARKYPDQPTRHDLADTVRIVASAALPTASPSDAVVVAHALARLCPDDRLLKRDVDRYCAAHQRRRPVARAAPTSATGRRRVSLLRTFELPGETDWTAFAADHDVLYAAGYHKSPKAGTLLPYLLLHNWHQEHCLLLLRQIYAQHEPLLLAADPWREHHVLLTSLRGHRLTEREVAAGRAVFLGGMPAWAPDHVAGVAFDGVGQAWMLVAVHDQLQVCCYSPRGELRYSRLLDLVPAGEVPSVPMMLVRGEDLWFAVNNCVIGFRTGGRMVRAEMPSPVLSLSATIPHSVIRLAVTLQEGGRVLMTGPSWGGELSFGEGLIDPVAAFTNDGRLVVASKGTGRLYDLNRGQLEHLADFEAPAAAPLAVLLTGNAREFAVATAGHVSVYRID
jgi:tetratricopeptide (TPR) repeat protein